MVVMCIPQHARQTL